MIEITEKGTALEKETENYVTKTNNKNLGGKKPQFS